MRELQEKTLLYFSNYNITSEVKMQKVLCFGSMNIDHVYQVNHFLRPGETAASLRYDIFPGGKGFNQSIALARAGCTVYHAGKVANDAQFMLDLMAQDKVNTQYLYQTGSSTGHAIIQVDHAGQNCILITAGANGEITRNEIDETLACFSPDDILLTQNEVADVPYLLTQGIARGMRVFWNPSPVPEDKTIPNGLYGLFINEVEGFEFTKQTNPEDIIACLLAAHPDLKIILTLGEQGAMYADATQTVRVPIVPCDAVDTTAAGDTFTGYFIANFEKDLSMAQVLTLACTASSIAVSRPGAAVSVPYAHEVSLG